MMRLFNTLSRRLEKFVPQSKAAVTLYTCGFTVYDYAHIGNLRAYIVWDTLHRALDGAGYQVRHVMNITDVGHLVSDADVGEDKLEKGARTSQQSVWEVADHYTQAFKHDVLALNILPPNGYHDSKQGDTYARATQFIPQQQDMVRLLLEKNVAYQTRQAIYFDVTKVLDYGALTGQKLRDKETGARHQVVTDPDKRHPQDFALWFFTVDHFADHSMRWPSPWGEGFPGWHLECSAIIHATLGDPIDIHTGGVDLIGTHHTNEMAQTAAAYGHPLARYWLHNEFILVNGGKMGKSLGNGFTLKDLIDRDFHPLAYRLLCLQAHYRSELNFTWESLAAAQQTLLNLYAWADRLHQESPSDLAVEPITQALNEDLATPTAIALLLAHTAAPSPEYLATVDQLLGLHLGDRPDITPQQKQLLAERETARQKQDWAEADRLRTALATQDLEVEDTPAGPRWRRTIVTNN